MSRSKWLRVCLPAVLVCLVAGVGWSAGAKKKLLYFTRSQGFEHGAVKRTNGQPALSEKILKDICEKAGYEIEITKDGASLTPDKIKGFDAYIFYATGNLLKPGGKDGGTPMTEAAFETLLSEVKDGKGFVGIHAGNDCMRNPGGPPTPYIQMLGGEFRGHGQQQPGTLRVVSPDFPGMDAIEGDALKMTEEWYVNTNLAPDMQVVLLQDTTGMKGNQYQIPSYPATWARMQGKGRVYYNSLGHRDDVWENPTVQKVMLAGIKWAAGDVEYKVKPNAQKVCSDAMKEMGAKK